MSGRALSIGAGIVNLRASGLRCRADQVCFAVFSAPGGALLTAANVERVAHELTHGYTHVDRPLAKWNYVRKTR